MRYSSVQVVFQEIPNEISLAIHVSGCALRCRNCHSSDLWNSKVGAELDRESLMELMTKYKKYVTCILFMGGEWEHENLISLIEIARSEQVKTALYTGLEYEDVNEQILSKLDYIKVGPYKENLGGLRSKNTNQRLIDLKTNKILNKYFIEEGTP